MLQSCAFGRHCIDVLIFLFDRHCIDVLIVLCFETHFQAKLPMSEIAATINEFRSRHLSELTEVSSFQFVFFLLDWVSGTVHVEIPGQVRDEMQTGVSCVSSSF